MQQPSAFLRSTMSESLCNTHGAFSPDSVARAVPREGRPAEHPGGAGAVLAKNSKGLQNPTEEVKCTGVLLRTRKD